MKKYGFTGKSKVVTDTSGHGIHVYQIVHSDGRIGGWIENEDCLSQIGKCWVDEDSIVYDKSVVQNNALVTGGAKVYHGSVIGGSAVIDGKRCSVYNSKIHGFAELTGSITVESSEIFDRAFISDEAHVKDSIVSDHAIIQDYAEVCDATITDYASIEDTAHVVGPVTIRGDASIIQDAYIKFKGKSYEKLDIAYGCTIGKSAEIHTQLDMIFATSPRELDAITFYKSRKGTPCDIWVATTGINCPLTNLGMEVKELYPDIYDDDEIFTYIDGMTEAVQTIFRELHK